MSAKFVFNLEVLKRLRKHRVGIAKREYLKIQARVFSLEDEIANLRLQISQTLGDSNAHMAKTGQVNGMSFLLQKASDKIKIIEEKISDLQPDVERHRRWMVEASRDLKAIELLEDKRKSEFDHQVLKREKRQMDQWASESVARKMALSTEEELQ